MQSVEKMVDADMSFYAAYRSGEASNNSSPVYRYGHVAFGLTLFSMFLENILRTFWHVLPGFVMCQF